jgi:hypothetical protein
MLPRAILVNSAAIVQMHVVLLARNLAFVSLFYASWGSARFYLFVHLVDRGNCDIDHRSGSRSPFQSCHRSRELSRDLAGDSPGSSADRKTRTGKFSYRSAS